MKSVKILSIGAIALSLTACGGYDKQECFNSAQEYMQERGGRAELIPGENWTYLGIDDSSVYYLEAMSTSHCNLTTVYQVNLK